MNSVREISIGKVATLINGYAFKPAHRGSSGLKIIRIQNLTNPNATYNLTELEVPEKYFVKSGDILIAWSATIDVFEWEGGPALLNQHIFKVEFNDDIIFKKYFVFALKKTIRELISRAHGSTMKHIVKSDFENHKIPFPNYSDQIKIATLLQKVEILIAKRKDSIALLDELVKSTFLEMFGDPFFNPKNWNLDKLENLIQIKNGFAFDSQYFTGVSDYVLMTPGNFFETGGYKDRGAKQKYYSGPLKKEFLLNPGDVLIAMTEQAPGLLGSALIVPSNGKFLHNQRLGLVQYNSNKSNPRFIESLFNSGWLRQNISKTSTGTKVKHTSVAKILSIQVFCPPIDLQNQFATTVEKIETLKQQAQESLAELQNLYGALSQKASKASWT